MAAVSIPVKLRGRVILAWIIALVLAGFALAFGAAAFNAPGQAAPLVTSGVLALLAAIALARALGFSIGWLSLGAATLELPDTLRLGVPLQARLVLQRPRPLDGFSFLLRCQTISRSRVGNNSSSSVSTRWSARPPVSAAASAMLIRLDLPADLPPSEPALRDGTWHRWRLEVKQPGFGGIGFSLDLPVQPAPPEVLARLAQVQASHVHELVRRTLAGQADAANQDGLLPRAIRVSLAPPGLVLELGTARYRGAALTLVLVGIMFTGLPLAVHYLSRLPGAHTSGPAFILPLFALIGCPVLLGGLYLAGQRQRLEVGPARLDSRTHWLLFSSGRQVPLDQLKDLLVDSTMSVGETRLYTLRALSYDGRKLKLCGGIAGELAAQYVRELVLKKLGR